MCPPGQAELVGVGSGSPSSKDTSWLPPKVSPATGLTRGRGMSDTWSVIWMGCELLFHRGISQEAHGSSRVDMSIPCCTNPSWSMSHDRASVRTQTTRNPGGEQSQGNLCPSPSQRGWPRAGCISGSHCPGEVTRVWVLTENATSLADTRTTVPNRAERKRKSPNTVQ